MKIRVSPPTQYEQDNYRKTAQVLFGLILVAFCLYASLFIYRMSFVVHGERFFSLLDDAMISMRYARNLANGHGLVWNPGGARVEGYTNLLWVLWMALFHLLPLSASKIGLAIQLSAVVFLLINLFWVKRIVYFISGGDGLAVLTAVFLTAFYYPLVYWSLGGMEVSVLVCLVDASIWLALRSVGQSRPSLALYLLLGVATLVRPDMIVTGVGILIYLLVVDSRNRAGNARLGLTIFSAFILLQTVFRFTYYGEFLPNTYYLKMTGYPFLLRISRGLIEMSKPLCTMLPLALLAPFVYRLLRKDTRVLLLFWVFATQVLYSIYVGGDAWEFWGRSNRYVTIAMPAFFILLGCTLADMRRLFLDSETAKPVSLSKKVVTLSAIALVFVAQISFNAIPRMKEFREWLLLDRPYTDAGKNSVETAMLLSRITTPDATIAVVSAGAVPYFTNRTAIDMLGKNDKKIAREKMRRLSDDSKLLYEYRAFYPGHLKWDYSYSIGELQPDVVVRIWGPHKEATPYLEKQYASALTPMGDIYLKRNSRNILWGKCEKLDRHGISGS